MSSDPSQLSEFQVRSIKHPLASDHYEPYGNQILESISFQNGEPIFTYRFQPLPAKHIPNTKVSPVTWNNSIHSFLEENSEILFKSGKVQKLRARILALKPDDEQKLINAILSTICQNLTFDASEAASISQSNFTEKQYFNTYEILENGKGICHDFSNVFVALSRSLGMPARMVYGIVLSDTKALQPHIWAEVRLQNNQWLPIEPQSESLSSTFFHTYFPLGYRELNPDESPGPVSYLNAEQYLTFF